MKDEIEKALKALAAKSIVAERSEDAMKFAQATLNMAHVLLTLREVNESKRKSAL